MESPSRSRPRPTAGVSPRVAPVAAIRLDPMGREDLAGLEGDDRDLELVGDGQDAPPRVGGADLEVVHPAAPPHREGALAVGDVVAEAEVPGRAPAGGPGLRERAIGRGRGAPADRPVGPLLVVDRAEGVELHLEPREIGGAGLPGQPALERLLEALDLALGLRVARRAVLLAD